MEGSTLDLLENAEDLMFLTWTILVLLNNTFQTIFRTRTFKGHLIYPPFFDFFTGPRGTGTFHIIFKTIDNAEPEQMNIYWYKNF